MMTTETAGHESLIARGSCQALAQRRPTAGTLLDRMMVPQPLVSVVVPTRDRVTRLRWLLNAMRDQTLDRGRFEIVVANGSRGPETAELLRTHELGRVGVLRELCTGRAPLPAQRDLAWRAAVAPLIAFTDDDCRPPEVWLERILQAAEHHPGAILQGATVPDPEELDILRHSTYARTQMIVPPTRWAQTCNIVYPRSVLERMDGFDLSMPSNFAGDDTDLALRSIAAGVEYVAAPEAVTYHAVWSGSILQRLRSGWRWSDLPYLVKRHPDLRRDLPLWIFWKRTHALLPLALAGVALQRRSRLAPLLMIPWAAQSAPDHTTSPRGRIRSTLELPGRALIDVVEIAALLRGSVRHRSILL
jgi:glycosyltransferase involved in cell wall biosynthesis